MKHVTLGNSRLEVPAVVAGCMRINSEDVYGVERFIDTALECGITYFDHADIYGNGDCERLMGQALTV